MTLTKREQIIAAGVGATLLVYVCGAYLVSPYIEQRRQLIAATDRANVQHKHDADLLANQPRVAAEWKKLTSSRLKSEIAQGTSKINDVLLDWARSARFDIQYKLDRAIQKGDFQQVRFQVSGDGNTESVSRFLLAVETTDLPLQIDDLRVNTRKEGINDLSVQLTVTTLVFSPPATTKPGAKPAAAKGDSL